MSKESIPKQATGVNGSNPVNDDPVDPDVVSQLLDPDDDVDSPVPDVVPQLHDDPVPVPHLLDPDDPDVEGLEIDGELHSFSCPCVPCKETPEEHEARFERILTFWADMDDDINQLSLANIFEMRFDGQLWPDEYRFDSRRGRWMEWKGGKWAGRWQETGTIMGSLGGLIYRLCRGKPSMASKWLKVAVFKDVLALAKEDMTVDTWDAWGEVLGLPNGDIWFLEKGWGEPNIQRLPITKTTGVDPAEYQGKTCRGDCKCIWHSFLSDVTGGDLDMQEGLQISVGASLFGGNRDHRLNVVCGDGGTGKSVFLNTIAKALGDYAGAMPASVLASKGNDHPTGLAGIVDKRFVVVPEVSGGMWKEETLKTITGGDAIPVRYMRQDFFVVKPECTLWVSTNQPPALRMVDDAIKRRLRIWPFTHKPIDVDAGLSERLQEPKMLGVVLQWALQGAASYARLGGELSDCDAVTEATSDYFSDVDTIGAWLEASTTESMLPEHDTGAAAAFKHYAAWCEAEGQKPSTRTSWGVSMGRRIERRHTKRGAVYAIELEGDGLVTGSSANPSPVKTPDSATKQGKF